MIKKISLLLLGIVITTIAIWPPIIHRYFPASLFFCMIGGFLIGWSGMKLLSGSR